MTDRTQTEVPADELEAARKAADEEWKRWTGGRTGLDGMHFFVQAALAAAAEMRATKADDQRAPAHFDMSHQPGDGC